MNLLELRTQFVKISGRYDLVVDTTAWADNGADFYINAGQNYLDRLRDTPKSYNSVFTALDAGEWYVTFARCRSIREVWINNSEGRSQLAKRSMNWLYGQYTAPVSETDPGTPLYYCPARLRSTDNIDQDDLGVFFNYIEDGSDSLRGILIFVPADEKIVVEVQGLFYSDELSVDVSESYWTLNWPETLVKASMYQLAIFLRDHRDADSWKTAIYSDLEGLDKDMVDESIAAITQIGG
jgi:hypothetical protein